MIKILHPERLELIADQAGKRFMSQSEYNAARRRHEIVEQGAMALALGIKINVQCATKKETEALTRDIEKLYNQYKDFIK